jgi:gliding motility-associated lipoprotein GldD
LDPGSYFLSILLQGSPSIISPDFYIGIGFFIESIVLVTLLFISGFISGAETAFFAITPVQFFNLKESENKRLQLVYTLLEKPKRLLATLLITVNFVNIAIVVLSSLMIEEVFDFTHHEWLGVLIQVVAVTFVIVLFCEVMPKVYATQNALRSASRSVYIIYGLDKILRPLSTILLYSTSLVDKRYGQKGYDVSVEELTHAIDITSDKSTPEEEKKILKGIARFGNIDVKQIMKSRMDVVAFDQKLKFKELIPLILEHRYSRVPVYDGSFDKVTGVLCVKDLLPFLSLKEDDTFDWRKQIRPAYFVPQSKKINDLLQEFQELKNHLAIVIDEYGGSSGIVTLEDVLEEIVGEINDEFDEEELFYSKLDERNFVFEGKTNLNDICRVMEIDRKEFDIENENIDTIAGLILEIKGSIPERNEVIKLNDISFSIESVDRKRIKRVKITLPEKNTTIPPGNGFTGMSALSLLFAVFFFACTLTSCEDEYMPKQRAYFRIDLPEKKYERFNSAECPFSFEYPVYSVVSADTGKLSERCWYNIDFTAFKGTLYLSYKPVESDLKKYIEDSRTLSMKHISRASGLNEKEIVNPEKKIYGVYYEVKGNAASSVQFYLTDSTKHFIRGALYFFAIPNHDSIAPVQTFIEQDVKHLIESFSWK